MMLRFGTILSLGEAMRRRDFIKVIGSVGVVWPLAERAQQPATPTIGFLRSTLKLR
jgi:hypothetical protein